MGVLNILDGHATLRRSVLLGSAGRRLEGSSLGRRSQLFHVISLCLQHEGFESCVSRLCMHVLPRSVCGSRSRFNLVFAKLSRPTREGAKLDNFAIGRYFHTRFHTASGRANKSQHVNELIHVEFPCRAPFCISLQKNSSKRQPTTC